MTTQADPKLTAAEVDAAWAAYEAARNAAVAGGWTYGLSMAAANAYAAYDRLNQKIVAKEVQV